MEEKLLIDRRGDGIHVVKDNRTVVDYFIYPEYEIHLNCLLAWAVQEWHFHSEIEEVLVVTKGVLTCKWKEDGVFVQPGQRKRTLCVCRILFIHFKMIQKKIRNLLSFALCRMEWIKERK